MARKVMIELQVEERQLPPGKEFGNYRFELRQGGVALYVQDSTLISVTFDAVQEGTYSANVSAMTADGMELAAVSVDVRVEAVEAPKFYLAPTGVTAMVV